MKVAAPEEGNVVHLFEVISPWTEGQSGKEKPILFCPTFGCANSQVNTLDRFQAHAGLVKGPIAIVFHYPGQFDPDSIINYTVSPPEFFDFGAWHKSLTPGQSSRRQHWGQLKTLFREFHSNIDDHGHSHRAKHTQTFMRKKATDGSNGGDWTCIYEDSDRDGGSLTYPLSPWANPKYKMAGKYRDTYAVYEPVLPAIGQHL